MKRVYYWMILAILPFLAASCGPATYMMNVELRRPSKSGLDLARKSFGMVYLDGGSYPDSLFAASIAEGFVEKLESEYFGGEQNVEIYRLDKEAGVDYDSKETLLGILLDMGSDVVFLLDTPVFGEVTASSPAKVLNQSVPSDSSYLSEVSVPYTIRINVFDSMNPADSVFSFNGASTAVAHVYSNGNSTSAELVRKGMRALAGPGYETGKLAASSFLSTWKNVSVPIIYFDASKWLDAVYAANEYRWKEALDIWLEFADSGNLMKRSCAAYNAAVACYMLGQNKLASEWLDRSDADYPLSVSRELRKIISK